MNAKLSDRIRTAKQRSPKAFGRVKREFGTVTEVRCPSSGTKLQSLVKVAERTEQRNGKPVVVEIHTLRPNAAYAELTMEMDDGSRHSTPVAIGEAKRAWTADELEDLYASDLDQWASEGMPGDLLERYAARKPVRVI